MNSKMGRFQGTEPIKYIGAHGGFLKGTSSARFIWSGIFSIYLITPKILLFFISSGKEQPSKGYRNWHRTPMDPAGTFLTLYLIW
jgi:hypothetical protein